MTTDPGAKNRIAVIGWLAVDPADPPDTGIEILETDMREYVIARSRALFSED